MGRINIGIAEDQKIYRRGLKTLLEDENKCKVIMEADDGRELLSKMKMQVPDIVVLDYRMKNLNGIDTAKRLVKKFPQVRILMLSMFEAEDYVIRAIENGANGYLVKDDDPEEILVAIDSIMNTGYYLNDRTSKILISKMVSGGVIQPKFGTPTEELTDIEIEIVKLICKEFSTVEISKKLFKSKRTIDGHRSSIMRKINAKNVTGIVMYAIKNKIVQL